MDSFDFDLTPQTKPVTLNGKQYLLAEATEDTAVKFKNLTGKAARFTGGDLTSVDGVANVEPFLVGMCLFPLGDDGKTPGPPVGEAFARTLPARVVGPMFDWVRDASGLGAKKDDPKSQSGTSSTSS